MAEIGTGKAIDKSISLPLCLHLRINLFLQWMHPQVSLAKELRLWHDINIGTEKIHQVIHFTPENRSRN